MGWKKYTEKESPQHYGGLKNSVTVFYLGLE